MRIFWITKLSDKTPFKATQFAMSDELRKRGHDVSLVLIKEFTERKKSTKDVMYIPTISVPVLSGIIFGLLLLFYFSFHFIKEKADVVIVDGDQIFSPFVLTLRLMRVPVIWDIRSLPIDRERSILHDISLYMTKYLVDGLTAITPELRSILRSNYKLNNKKIGLWSTGVSMQVFNSDINSTTRNRNETSEFRLIYHGTYSPTRGIEELIQSIGEIEKPIRNNVKLMIVGIDGDKRNDLMKLCNQLEVEDYVDIFPPVDQSKIPSFIQRADIGVIPLPPENVWWRVSVPLKTLEYLAMGKPIVVTDIPFHRKIMNECKCGVIINSSDPKDIAKAICHLYNNRNELEKMGECGKKLVMEQYSWETKASELEDFIKTILVKT